MIEKKSGIFEKKYYKLTEVCGLTGVKPYVLRFWESEFVEICPHVNENGQKLYTDDDLKIILKIKNYLFENKLTIEQTKKELVLEEEMDLTESVESKITEEERFSQKLILAKAKLSSLITMAQDVKHRNNWH